MIRVWVSIALVILALSLLLVAWQVREHDLQKIEELARSTNAALCAFRDDLERRAVLTAELLAEYPDGIAGISRANLIRSLANQNSTLEALQHLECESEE